MKDGVIVGHAGGQVNRDGALKTPVRSSGRGATGFVVRIGRHTPGAESPISLTELRDKETQG